MMRRLALLIVLVISGLAAERARADFDDRPGLDWRPLSTATQPCGNGAPARGHFAREIRPNARGRALTLVVRQDGTRLCYVVDDIAEAPVLRLRQGETLTLTLRNEITDPAAEAKVLPGGKLEQPNQAVPAAAGFTPVEPGMRHDLTGRTNLHVHGFAVPPSVPQDEVLDGCVDPAVGPATCGRREITYRYQVPADMPPGLYWYHPHLHGEVQAQMLMGLSGAIVVEGPDDDARSAAEIRDRVFVVRQQQDNDAGHLAAAAAAKAPRGVAVTRIAAPPRDPTVAGLKIDTADELGCSNASAIDEITLNGSPVVDGEARDDQLAPTPMGQGTTELWRVLNAATDAFLDLAVIGEDGARLPVRVIARDGAPLSDDAGKPLPARATTEAQLVPPAGRIEFLVTAPPLGHKAYLVSHAVDTGCAGDRVPERRLALITTLPIIGGTDTVAATPPAGQGRPDLFSGLLAARTDRTRVIAFAEYPRPGSDDQTDFYIAERRDGTVLKPFHMGDAPSIIIPAGSVEEWTVENWTREVHAFHIHQLHFRVLEVNGQRQINPPLLDTVTVPAAMAAVPGQVRIKLAFPAALAGDIPFHCHLVDHEDNGMMGVLRVVPPGDPVRKADLSDLLKRSICRPYSAALGNASPRSSGAS